MMVMGQWVLGRPPEGSTTATGAFYLVALVIGPGLKV